MRRAATARRARRLDGAASRSRLRAATIGFWALPLVLWQLASGSATARQLLPLIAVAVMIVLVTFATRLKARYRHGSQAFRLTMTTLGLVVPAFALYPSMFQLG